MIIIIFNLEIYCGTEGTLIEYSPLPPAIFPVRSFCPLLFITSVAFGPSSSIHYFFFIESQA